MQDDEKRSENSARKDELDVPRIYDAFSEFTKAACNAGDIMSDEPVIPLKSALFLIHNLLTEIVARVEAGKMEILFDRKSPKGGNHAGRLSRRENYNAAKDADIEIIKSFMR